MHALGVIAFLGLTGRPPRPAGSVADVVAASVQPVDPVSALEPGLGSAFDEPIARALARNPSLRPTATEAGSMLAAGLERWRAAPGSMGCTIRPPSPGCRFPPTPSRRGRRADAAAPARTHADRDRRPARRRRARVGGFSALRIRRFGSAGVSLAISQRWWECVSLRERDGERDCGPVCRRPRCQRRDASGHRRCPRA